MTISLGPYIHNSIPIASSMKLHGVKVITAMKIEIHSRKLIKPSVSTPLNRRCYKISVIDELAPNMNLPLVLFFPPTTHYNPMFVKKLEESMEKTLTLLYPLAGRYMEHIRTVDCNDQGVDFAQARADITIQEILDPKMDPMLINDFIPSKRCVTNLQTNDAMLATQITMLKCGGLALGISMAHRICDASTMTNFVNQWATLSQRDSNIDLSVVDFTSSSLFPAQGLPFVEAGFSNGVNDDDCVTKKLSFNQNAISNMKDKVKLEGKRNIHQLSKVQLVSALIWKAFIGVDHALYGQPRDTVLVQLVPLRQKKEKISSLVPNRTLGNHWSILANECGTTKTTKEFYDLTYLLANSFMKTIKDYSKVGHDSNKRNEMILNSCADIANIPDTTSVVWLGSWCKVPIYDVDFGFGKPVWVSFGFVPFKRGMMLIDDASVDGVEAYVTMGVKDIPHFKQDEGIKAFYA